VWTFPPASAFLLFKKALFAKKDNCGQITSQAFLFMKFKLNGSSAQCFLGTESENVMHNQEFKIQ